MSYIVLNQNVKLNNIRSKQSRHIIISTNVTNIRMDLFDIEINLFVLT